MKKFTTITLLITIGLFATNIEDNITKDINKMLQNNTMESTTNGGTSKIDEVIKKGKIIKQIKYVDKETGETKKITHIVSNEGTVIITDIIGKKGKIKSRIKEFTTTSSTLSRVDELFKNMRNKIQKIDNEYNASSKVKSLFNQIKDKMIKFK